MPHINAWFHQAIVRYSRIATCTAGYWIRLSRWPTYSWSRNASSLNFHSFFISYFLSVFHQYLFSWSKWIVCNRPAHINIAFMGKPVSTYVVSTDIAGVGTTYDVTWGDASDYSSTAQIAEENADIADGFKNQYPKNSLIRNSCFSHIRHGLY